MDVLVFEVGGIRYALPVPQAREVVRAVTIVPLPRAPSIVEGLIDVRGDLVPVLDVRARFRLPPKALSPADQLILAHAGSRLVAIRADRVVDLVQVDAAAIDDAGAVVRRPEYVAGVAKLADGLVLIHDLRTFLDDSEGLALDRAMAEPTPSERPV